MQGSKADYLLALESSNMKKKREELYYEITIICA